MLIHQSETVSVPPSVFQTVRPTNPTNATTLSTDADLMAALSYLAPDNYGEWLEVGMCLHAGGYPLNLWDEWSSRSSKYKQGECAVKWSTFSASNGKTIASLFYKARQAGMPIRNSFKKELKAEHGRLKPLHWNDLKSLPKSEYLVKGLIDKQSTIVVYGESNTGKSFITLDISVHIASGREWNGHKVMQGSVVYIAAEGGLGLQNRLEALRIHYGLTEIPPFYVIPKAPDLCNGVADVEELIREVNQIPNVTLIVVDTLSRTMAGGNENSPEDMGAFIKCCDTLREGAHSSIMIIHHSGKDSSRGARGHSSLRAAADTELEVCKHDGQTILEIKKQRDAPTGGKLAFTLSSVSIGLDDDGLPVSSCVPIKSVLGSQTEVKTSEGEAIVLSEARMVFATDGVLRQFSNGKHLPCLTKSELHKKLITKNFLKSQKPDSARRILNRHISHLVDKGILQEREGFLLLPDKSDKSGQNDGLSRLQSDGQDIPL